MPIHMVDAAKASNIWHKISDAVWRYDLLHFVSLFQCEKRRMGTHSIAFDGSLQKLWAQCNY